MGAEHDVGLDVALHEAHGIVAEQLRRLCELAASVRRAGEAHAVALRQAERQLDEAMLQYRNAVQRGSTNAVALGTRVAELRERCEALRRDMLSSQHALRQLDQLVRQIEMSSATLLETESETSADPWALALRAQVIHGREEERVRLAREVHDGPAQVLANSLMLLETCYTLAQQTGHERLVQMLDRMRQATREGLQEVRRFIADLRPGQVAERGLTDGLREYIRGYNNAYNADVALESEPVGRLASEVEIVLYRIVQEALQNAHKYARGAHVTVRLVRQGARLALSVRDDGPGFDPHEVARRAGRSNWGLTSMRERAELIGARLTVASRPGHGTEVTVTLPLE
ncbi:MAG TPA: sensor histidine kinase [Roseiflexaceae bacterium]|nr:sensor histidine kinase [Roseiflexaceae bacterium]